jgi:hypothetical protein
MYRVDEPESPPPEPLLLELAPPELLPPELLDEPGLAGEELLLHPAEPICAAASVAKAMIPRRAVFRMRKISVLRRRAAWLARTVTLAGKVRIAAHAIFQAR